MMQFFEWNIEADGSQWNSLKKLVQELKKRGIDFLLLPKVNQSMIQGMASMMSMIWVNSIKKERFVPNMVQNKNC